jgi:hypothetical protein
VRRRLAVAQELRWLALGSASFHSQPRSRRERRASVIRHGPCSYGGHRSSTKAHDGPDPFIIIPFAELTLADVSRVGGKNASLGELLRFLVPLGVRVPEGFAVTAQAFVEHLEAAGLADQIYPGLARLDVRDVEALAREGARIRGLLRSAALPEAVAEGVRVAYRALSETVTQPEAREAHITRCGRWRSSFLGRGARVACRARGAQLHRSRARHAALQPARAGADSGPRVARMLQLAATG